MTATRAVTIAVTIALCVGCNAPRRAPDGAPPVMYAGRGLDAQGLLAIATNPGLPPDERARAADGLGEVRSRSAVPQLVEMLPGDFDVLTFSVVRALGRIGDPAALPKLREVDGLSTRVRVPGAINAAVRSAIEALETGDSSRAELSGFPLFDLGPLHDQVEAVLRRHYPAANSRLLEDAIHFEHHVDVFVIRERSTTSRSPEPRNVRGPNGDGIFGYIRIATGGAATAPQTFDRGTFQETLLAPYSPKLNVRLLAAVKHPSGAGDAFLRELATLLNDFDRYVSRVRDGD